ncbi:MAG TPA: acyl-CoA dehydrogenase family protein [Iamia sp.]|nr:acyl-CoA dehydrogenase family protein [Iamia sp.]
MRLAEVLPALPPEPPPDDWPAKRAYATGWQGILHETGYAGIAWLAEFGGRGVTPAEELILLEETERAGAPDVGCSFVGPLHAKEREQFGRPIGSFQAVKHLLADAAVAIETARAAHAADLACRTGTQVHGGMGDTWELDAHLLLERSIVLDTALGGVEACDEAVAEALS